MSLSAFEREVLGRVSDDYEAVHTIRGDLARDLGRLVSDEEVASALLGLVRSGLVDAFVYDHATAEFRRVEAEKSPVDDLWFHTNQAGRPEHERSVA